jgi:hypothetical protein
MQNLGSQPYQAVAPPPQPTAVAPPPTPRPVRLMAPPQSLQSQVPTQPAMPTQQPQYDAPAGGIPAQQFQQPYPASQPASDVPPEQSAASDPPPPADTQAIDQPASKAHKKRKARKELQRAIGHSNEILASAQTVFPFTLFPDSITIDRGKLSIAHRSFFRAAEATSIRIEDILNTTANVGPLFGSVKITTRFFGTNKDYQINYLKRSDALKIKHILQGYIIALQEKIDCSALSTAELSRMLQEIGADAPTR